METEEGWIGGRKRDGRLLGEEEGGETAACCKINLLKKRFASLQTSDTQGSFVDLSLVLKRKLSLPSNQETNQTQPAGTAP